MPGSRVSTSPPTCTRITLGRPRRSYPVGCGLCHDLVIPVRSCGLGLARALELFDFEYKIEVYTPAARRRYGYYSLPILHNGGLVGRLDAKAHRKQGTFEVKAIHLEPDTPVNDDLVCGFAGALRDCAGWHKTPEVLVRWSDPSELTETLRLALDEGTVPPTLGSAKTT